MPGAPGAGLIGHQLPADDQALDVAGALVDLANAHVAADPLDGKTLQVAIAAMDLDGVGEDAPTAPASRSMSPSSSSSGSSRVLRAARRKKLLLSVNSQTLVTPFTNQFPIG